MINDLRNSVIAQLKEEIASAEGTRVSELNRLLTQIEASSDGGGPSDEDCKLSADLGPECLMTIVNWSRWCR